MVRGGTILIRAITMAAILLSAAVLQGCARRELVDAGNTHYVRVYVDNTLKNVTTGFYNEEYDRPAYEDPQIMRIMLCDPASGLMVAERYLRNRHEDKHGIYYDGYVICDAGNYNVMAYNFGTESTLLRDENSFIGIEAYTSGVAPHILSRLAGRGRTPGEEIVYMPDHLFRAECRDVHLAPSPSLDTLRTAAGEWFAGTSIVKSYYMQLRIKGAQHASSIVGLMSGMGGSVRLSGAELQIQNPVTIYMGFSTAPMLSGDAILYTTFHTFGKLPEAESHLELTFDIITTDGRGHSLTVDITDEFTKPAALEHQWLLLDKVLEIPEPEAGGGGFAPGINDWADVNTDIII